MPLGSGADAVVAGVLGLLVGSFLNVVIHRHPLGMYRAWLDESIDNLVPAEGIPGLWRLVFGARSTPPPALEAAATAAQGEVRALPPLTLTRPRSRCAHCGAPIHWYQNVPVLSYLALRGRCASCKARISLRYPLVEIATAALFAVCGARWGLGPQAATWAAFCALLVCLAIIDFDTQLLPDDLNYPLLWLGLIAAALGFTVPLASAVWGAVAGYLSLWSIYQLFKLLTGKEGMGYGDFKLLAALGAWFGLPFLLPIVLLSSVVGAVLGLALIVAGRLANRHIPMPFGPFLAGAGLLCFLLTPPEVAQLLPFAFPFR